MCGVSESLQRQAQLVGGKGVHQIKEGVSLWGPGEGGRLIQSHGEPQTPFGLAARGRRAWRRAEGGESYCRKTQSSKKAATALRETGHAHCSQWP